MGRAHVALLWCSVSQRYISIGRFPASKYSAHKAVLHIKEARMMSSWGLTCSWKCSTNISQPSHKGTVYSVDHTRRVLLWFFLPGHWGISQSPHASSEELPHCLRSHPNLHLAGMPGERTGSLRHHGLLIHLQSKSKSRVWQNTDRKYPMAIKLLRSLQESLVFLYSLKKKKINQEH